MRTPKGNGGWFSGDKNMKGAAQGTYQLYCALNLCYEWMQVVIKFGLDIKLDNKKLNHHAPLMLDVISRFIQKILMRKGRLLMPTINYWMYQVNLARWLRVLTSTK